MINNLHQIKDIGLKTRECLEKGDVDMLGELLHVHLQPINQVVSLVPSGGLNPQGWFILSSIG
jgi:hypothetical protein